MGTPNKCYLTTDGPIWHSRSVAVAHVVFLKFKENAYILMTKRSELMEDAPGKWCLPCGYLDWDESLEEAARREVLEETGLNLSDSSLGELLVNTQLIGISNGLETKKQNVSVHFSSILFTDKMPLLTKSEETEEVVWVLTKNIPEIKDSLAFNHYDVLRGAITVLKAIYM